MERLNLENQRIRRALRKTRRGRLALEHFAAAVALKQQGRKRESRSHDRIAQRWAERALRNG